MAEVSTVSMANSPPSAACDLRRPAGWKPRVLGATLALLVQTGFLLPLLLSPDPPSLASLAHETTLFFPILPAAPPSIIDARGPRKKRTSPSLSAVPRAASPVAAPAPASSSTLAGFGQALFGCAPEHFADLTPEQRDHCPKPGEGLAHNEAPDLMGAPSHVKDNARWANAMAHKQILRMMPGGLLWPLVALGAVLDGSISEPHSAFRDPEQWPDERDPAQFMPRDLNDEQRINDAWRRDHTLPPSDGRQAAPAANH